MMMYDEEIPSKCTIIFFNFFIFCGDKSPFCGATGILFQTLVDSAHWFQSQGGSIITCTIPRPRPGPNFTPWYGEGAAGATAQYYFQDGWLISPDRLHHVIFLNESVGRSA